MQLPASEKRVLIMQSRRSSSARWVARTVLNVLTLCALLAAGCTYLRGVARQRNYEARRDQQPGLWLSKHLLEQDTFFVYGRLLPDAASPDRHAMAVAAVSSRYRQDEIVDITHLGRTGSYFGLNLPAGDYTLLALADGDDDGSYEPSEVVASRALRLARSSFPHKVAPHIDLHLTAPAAVQLAALPIRVPAAAVRRESLFYPKGTLRELSDPIFAPSMSELGMYDPAAFMEAAPMMFYALEEDYAHKIPVIFIHGMGGSAREFEAMVARLDRARYKPWFFHYPSGMDLEQLAQLFYDIFLSGKVIPSFGMPTVIVAHSMGGLVVREAMNLCGTRPGEARVDSIITIATPLGGHPAARRGIDSAPMVLPAWRDLDPAGRFIARLFRKPLPEHTAHHVIFTYEDAADLASGTASDGVVAVADQLPAAARAQLTTVAGFQSGHADVLRSRAAIDRVVFLVRRAHNLLPEDHLGLLIRGGFDVPLGASYTEVEKYAIGCCSRHLQALARGTIKPLFPVQEHFIMVDRGDAAPANEFETAWLKLKADYPALTAPAPVR